MWFLPSTERPTGFRLIVEDIERTAPQAKICALLRSDDPDYDTYREVVENSPLDIVVCYHELYGCAAIWQRAFETYPDEAFYGFVADDLQITEPNWDKMLELAAGPWGFAWPDDGVHGEGMATHPCVGGELVRAVGYWGPPGFFHNCIDVVWMDIAGSLDVAFFCPTIRHKHSHWFMGSRDKDHLDAMVHRHHEADCERYKQYVASPEFKELLASVKREYLRVGQQKAS